MASDSLSTAFIWSLSYHFFREHFMHVTASDVKIFSRRRPMLNVKPTFLYRFQCPPGRSIDHHRAVFCFCCPACAVVNFPAAIFQAALSGSPGYSSPPHFSVELSGVVYLPWRRCGVFYSESGVQQQLVSHRCAHDKPEAGDHFLKECLACCWLCSYSLCLSKFRLLLVLLSFQSHPVQPP